MMTKFLKIERCFVNVFTWFVFNDENKYYLQVFLEKCLHKLAEKNTKKHNIQTISFLLKV